MPRESYLRQCPICGKIFAVWVPEGWAYKRKIYGYKMGIPDKLVYYCSWHCLRETEKNKRRNKHENNP